MMAGVVVVLVPSLSIFVFMQKQLIDGLMAGAVKKLTCNFHQKVKK